MQTEVSTQQSKTITVFTLVTIIFSPLSFMASVFGMNVSQWSSVPTNPDLRWVLKILGSVSLAVIILALLVAFNRFTRAFVHWAWEWVEWFFVGALNLVGLGWLTGSIHNRVSRMFTRLPRNGFTWNWAHSAGSDKGEFSRSSTLMSAKSSSRLKSRADSSPPAQPSLWHRQRLQRNATGEVEEVTMEKADPNVEGDESSNGQIPEKRRVPTWGRSAPRVSMLFNAVRYDRGTRNNIAEEPEPV
jgi:CorA-like Mg2+ transporter protein